MKKILNILSIIISIAAISMICFKTGYKKGANEGITVALDTVSAIARKHVKKDTCAVVIIAASDTNVFVLSKKTVKIKK